MLKNDELTGIDGVTFEYYDQFRDYLKQNSNQSVMLNVSRDGTNIDIPVKLDSTGLLGVATNKSYAEYFELATIKYGFFSSIPAGIKKGIKTGKDYLKQFKILFTMIPRHTNPWRVYHYRQYIPYGTGRFSEI